MTGLESIARISPISDALPLVVGGSFPSPTPFGPPRQRAKGGAQSMIDHPILFSAPMVHGILAGHKTETRRLARGSRINTGCEDDRPVYRASPWQRVQPGDWLWVRENWRAPKQWDAKKPSELIPRSMTIHFAAGGCISNIDRRGDWRPDPNPSAMPPWAGKLRPGIFLPRWASRLTLTIMTVRIEPLQAITEAGALAEGITGAGRDWRAGAMAQGTDPIAAYKALWWALHGIESWNQNPEVVVISFTAIQGNIDAEAR